MALIKRPNSNLKIVEVELSKIKVKRAGLRIDADVKGLIDSIKEIGLINPPTVNQNYELVAGGRRYAAIKALGWKKIPVIIYESAADDRANLQEDLVHLDENLIRLDLSKVEAEDAIAKRKRIYEHLYPDTKKGGDRKSEKIKGQESSLDSFVEDTARKTGKSKSSIKDAVRRSEKSSPTLQAAREADLINATQATELVKLNKDDQDALVPHLENKSVAEVKQIVAKVQAVGISEALKGVQLANPAVKHFSDLKVAANRLTSVLVRIAEEQFLFVGTERLDAVSILSKVEKYLNEFYISQNQEHGESQ